MHFKWLKFDENYRYSDWRFLVTLICIGSVLCAYFINAMYVVSEFSKLMNDDVTEHVKVNVIDVKHVCDINNIPVFFNLTFYNPTNVKFTMEAPTVECYLEETLLMTLNKIQNLEFLPKRENNFLVNTSFSAKGEAFRKFLSKEKFPPVNLIFKTKFETKAFWIPLSIEMKIPKLLEMNNVLGVEEPLDFFVIEKVGLSSDMDHVIANAQVSYSKEKIPEHLKFKLSPFSGILTLNNTSKEIIEFHVPEHTNEKPFTVKVQGNATQIQSISEILKTYKDHKSYGLNVKLTNAKESKCDWLKVSPIVKFAVTNAFQNVSLDNITSYHAKIVNSSVKDDQKLVLSTAVEIDMSKMLPENLASFELDFPLTLFMEGHGNQKAFEVEVSPHKSSLDKLKLNIDLILTNTSEILLFIVDELFESSPSTKDNVIKIFGQPNKNLMSSIFTQENSLLLPVSEIPWIWNSKTKSLKKNLQSVFKNLNVKVSADHKSFLMNFKAEMKDELPADAKVLGYLEWDDFNVFVQKDENWDLPFKFTFQAENGKGVIHQDQQNFKLIHFLPINIKMQIDLVDENATDESIIKAIEKMFSAMKNDKLELKLNIQHFNQNIFVPIEALVSQSLRAKFLDLFYSLFQIEAQSDIVPGQSTQSITFKQFVLGIMERAVKPNSDVKVEEFILEHTKSLKDIIQNFATYYENLDLPETITEKLPKIPDLLKVEQVSSFVKFLTDDSIKCVLFLLHHMNNNLEANDLPRKLFRIFIREIVVFIAKEFNNVSKELVNVDYIVDKLDPQELPKSMANFMKVFITNYFTEINDNLKFKMLFSVFDLNKTHGMEHIISNAINNAGPFLQKLFQMLGDCLAKVNEADDPVKYQEFLKVKNLLAAVKEDIKPMSHSEYLQQISQHNVAKKYDINSTSVSAGSIGQVHFAYKKKSNGDIDYTKEFAIKVMRPGLLEKLSYEEELLEVLFEDEENAKQKRVFSILMDSIKEELNYDNEFKYGKIGYNLYKKNHRIRSIKYIETFETVLVMKKDEGKSLNSLDPKDVDDPCVLVDLISEILQDWFKHAIFDEAGFFHGDLHGGNVLMTYKGAASYATIIDYGNSHLVKNPEFREAYFKIGVGICVGNVDIVLEGLGKPVDPPEEEEEEWDKLKEELIELFNQRSKSTIFHLMEFTQIGHHIDKTLEMAIKIIGEHAILPYTDKTIDFFKSKMLVENQFKIIAEKFPEKIKKCKVQAPFFQYVMASGTQVSKSLGPSISVGTRTAIKDGLASLNQIFKTVKDGKVISSASAAAGSTMNTVKSMTESLISMLDGIVVALGGSND